MRKSLFSCVIDAKVEIAALAHCLLNSQYQRISLSSSCGLEGKCPLFCKPIWTK